MMKSLIFLLLLPIFINAASELPIDVDATSAAADDSMNSLSLPSSSTAQVDAAAASSPTAPIATKETVPTSPVPTASSNSRIIAISAATAYYSNSLASLMTAAATAFTAPAATEATLDTTLAPLYTDSASLAYAPARLLLTASIPAGTSTANTSGDHSPSISGGHLTITSGDPAPLASTYSHPSAGNAGDLLADIDRMEEAVRDCISPPRSIEELMSECSELDFVKAQLADCREMYDFCRAKLTELRLRLQKSESKSKREEEAESCMCSS